MSLIRKQDDIESVLDQLNALTARMMEINAKYTSKSTGTTQSGEEQSAVLLGLKVPNLEPRIRLENVVISASDESQPPLYLRSESTSMAISPTALQYISGQSEARLRLSLEMPRSEAVTPILPIQEEKEIRIKPPQMPETRQQLRRMMGTVVALSTEAPDTSIHGDELSQADAARLAALASKLTTERASATKGDAKIQLPTTGMWSSTRIEVNSKAHFAPVKSLGVVQGQRYQDSTPGPQIVLEEARNGNTIFSVSTAPSPWISLQKPITEIFDSITEYDQVSFVCTIENIGTKVLEELARVPGIVGPIQIVEEEITCQFR